jgi:hypothetical protein
MQIVVFGNQSAGIEQGFVAGQKSKLLLDAPFSHMMIFCSAVTCTRFGLKYSPDHRCPGHLYR